jgi:site-specific recombinase XerD
MCSDDEILAGLASRPESKAISVAMDLSVIREFWKYLRRRNPRRFAREPRWPRLPKEPRFLAHALFREHVRLLLRPIREEPWKRRHLPVPRRWQFLQILQQLKRGRAHRPAL